MPQYRLGHTIAFSDYPQVHSGPGDAINTGNVRPGFAKKIALTA